MRLVIAIVSFLLAAAALTLGIAQRTIWAPPDSVDLAVSTTGTAPLTVVEGATLLSHDGRQTLTISGAEQVTAAYGRTSDVYAWIGDASYNLVTVDPTTGQLVSELHQGAESTVPSLVGSDLWYDDYQDAGHLRLSVTLPADDAVLIAADGTAPAPSDLAISWPLDDSTPWSGPLIIGGAVLLVFGLVMLLTAIYRIRGDHGPRRRMPKLPKQKTIKSVRPATRIPAKTGTTTAIALLVAGAALAIPAASPAQALEAGGAAATDTPTPTPSPDETAEPAAPVPAVTTPQLDRIVDRVRSTLAQADSTLDDTVLATRASGPAYQLKAADYTLLSKDSKATADSPAIPADGVVALRLPQQVPASGWTARTVLVVIASPDSLATSTPAPSDTPAADGTTAPADAASGSATPEATGTGTPAADATAPAADATAAASVPATLPVVMVLRQDTPRDNFKVEYLLTLQAAVPEVAASTVGAALLAPDTPLLGQGRSPEAVAAAYADVLAKDSESQSYAAFDLTGDSLVKAWGLAAQQAEQKKQQALASPNKVAYTTTAEIDPAKTHFVALATTDAGALVTATVGQVMQVTPGESGAKVVAQGDVKTLSGVERSGKGYQVTYGGEVLFFVPAALDTAATATAQPITVLGYAQGLLSAKEIP